MDRKNSLQDDATSTMTRLSVNDLTPTHTSPPTEGDTRDHDTFGGGIQAVPWAGERFVILHRDSGQAIAINDDGDVRLDRFIHVSTTCQWLCVESKGFFGFKHEGRYLGNDNAYGIHAESKHHSTYEWIMARKHPNGGYQLLMPFQNEYRFVAVMGVGLGGHKLVISCKVETAASWDFLKV